MCDHGCCESGTTFGLNSKHIFGEKPTVKHYAVTTKGKMHCKKTKVEKTYKFKATASADFGVFSLQQRVENSEIC